MSSAAITKTVYGLYYPETRAIVDALWASRPHHWYERNYEKRQDPMHGPFLDRWRAWSAGAGVVLGDAFPHAYPTSGASEGIHALIARIGSSTSSPRPRIHVFDGEYEGYRHIAAAMQLEVCAHHRDRYGETLSSARPGDWMFVSEPSAIDGCSWAGFSRFVGWAEERSLQLAVDLSYVGAIPERRELDLRAPNVAVVWFSLSKPFGVYYHRIGGWLSREPMASLHGNLWFKNLFSIHLGEALMAAHGPLELPRKYRPLQRRTLSRAIEAGVIDAGATASDVVVLAHAKVGPGHEFERAGGTARWCLTGAIDALIAEESRP